MAEKLTEMSIVRVTPSITAGLRVQAARAGLSFSEIQRAALYLAARQGVNLANVDKSLLDRPTARRTRKGEDNA